MSNQHLYDGLKSAKIETFVENPLTYPKKPDAYIFPPSIYYAAYVCVWEKDSGVGTAQKSSSEGLTAASACVIHFHMHNS